MAPRKKKQSQDGDEDYLSDDYEEETESGKDDEESERGEELTTEKKSGVGRKIESSLRSTRSSSTLVVAYPSLKKGDWTEEEEATLIELRGQKERWVDIGKELGGRSPMEVKNHWNSMRIQEEIRQNGNKKKKSNNRKKKNNRNKGASGGVNNQTGGRVGRGKSDGSSRRSRRSREKLDEEEEEEEEVGNEANQNDDDDEEEEGDDADEEEEQEDDDDEEEKQEDDDDEEEEVENERGGRRGSKRCTRRSQQPSDDDDEEVERKRGGRSGSKRRTRRSHQQSDEEQEDEVDNGVKQEEGSGTTPNRELRLKSLLDRKFTFYCRRDGGDTAPTLLTSIRLDKVIDEQNGKVSYDLLGAKVLAKVFKQPRATLEDLHVLYQGHKGCLTVEDSEDLEEAILMHLNNPKTKDEAIMILDVKLTSSVPAAAAPRAAAAAALPASTGAPPIDHPARSFWTPEYDTSTVNAAAGGPLINDLPRAGRPGEDDSMDDDALRGSASSLTHTVPTALTSPVASVPFNPNATPLNDPAHVALSGEDGASDDNVLTSKVRSPIHTVPVAFSPPAAAVHSNQAASPINGPAHAGQPGDIDSSDDDFSHSEYTGMAPTSPPVAADEGQGVKRKIDEKSSDTLQGASGKRGKPT